MNRIHKSIFNEQTGTYVAVSENTKNKCKKGNKVLAATALSAALGLGAMGSAQAQLVDACAGVSLPRSVVTEIVGQVVTPIYEPIEDTVNGILGPVDVILDALLIGQLLPGPLTLNLTDILNSAAAGDPITLGVLNANGEVVGPTDSCDLTADSLNLTDPAGIAIGGNKITGLGSDAAGAAAVSSAADFTSIALGNFSQATQSKAIAFGEAAKAFGEGSIAVGADALAANENATALGNAAQATGQDSVAIGAGAQANAANSVALGNGSVATAANTVSVGSVGNERKITNVADGLVAAGSTDAINGGQLHQLAISTGLGLVQQADNLAPITVGKDSAGTEVNFANVAAQTRKLTGVANGSVAAGSTEAITGDQLYASTSNLATVLAGGAGVDANGNLIAPSYVLDDGTNTGSTVALDTVGGALANLDGRVATNTGDISDIKTDITNIEGDITNITNGTQGIVKQTAAGENILVGSETDGAAVDFTGTAGVRKLTGLADGELSATSTDAVTGKQLNQTNQSIATLADNAVTYDDATKTAITLAGVGGTTLTNVKAGTVSASSTDAINGAQLYASTSNLATVLAGGAGVDANGNLIAPSYVLDDGTNTGSTVALDTVGGALANLDGRVATNTGDISDIKTDITNIEGDITNITNGTQGIVKQTAAGENILVGSETDGAAVDFTGTAGVRKLTGLADGELSATSTDAVTGKQLNQTNQSIATLADNAVKYDDATKTAITLAGVGGTTLTNVKAGAVSASSTDAINGAQLYASTSNLATVLAGGAGVDANGNLIAPSYVLDDGTNTGTTVALDTVGGALANLDGRVATNTGDISDIRTDITNITNGTLGIVKQDTLTRAINVGGETDGTEVNFTGTAGVRKLTGIAKGSVVAGSTDAITGDQLYASNQSVADALGGNSEVDPVTGTVSAPVYELDDGTDTGTKTDVTGVEGALDNLDGRVASNRTEITTIKGNISTIQTDITNITNGTLGIVKQNTTTREIAIGGETDGTRINVAGTEGNRTLTGLANGNVAAGSTDAVNGAQLHSTNVDLATALTALNAGVDPITGAATAPEYVLYDGTSSGGTETYNTVGGALGNLNGRVASNTTRIDTIEGDITNIKGDITNIQGDITNIQNGTAGIVKFDAVADKVTVGSEVAGKSVDFTGTEGARKLTGVKDGDVSATSSDAVTGKQLYATNQQVKATASALGGGAEAKDDGTFVNPLYALQEIQPDGSKADVSFTNVGGALTSLNTSVASLQNQINNNTSIGLVRQDSSSRVISVGGNTDGTEVNFANSNGEARVISGVAAGKGPTDAVNVQQAQEMISGASTALRGEIRRAERRADAGTAAATAVATLGQAYQPGQSAFSVGGGVWRGESGYAMGVSTVSENGKWLLKGAVNGSGRGGAGGGASVTYLW